VLFRKICSGALLITILAACGGGGNSNSAANTAASAGGAMASAAGNAAQAVGSAAGNAAQGVASAAGAAGNMAASAGGAMANKVAQAIPATLHCGAVQPVWTNPRSHAYFEPSSPYYGKTTNGQYMCPSAAVAAGYHKASGRHHHGMMETAPTPVST
jgi:type IV secretory pathway TrbL component